MTDKQNSKNLLVNIIVFGLGVLGSKIIMFFMVPLYTNVLSTEEYGIAELVLTFAEFFIPVFSVVIFESVLRFGLDKNEVRKNVLKAAMFVFLIGSLLMICVTPILHVYEPISPYVWYLCVHVIVYIFSAIELMYLKVNGKNKLYAILSVTQTFTLAISNIILLVCFSLGVNGYLISTIFSHIIISLLAFYFGGIYKDLFSSRFSWNLTRRMLLYSLPLIINNLSWWIIHSSDKLMIESMMDNSSLGLYTAAAKIPSLMSILVSVFSQAWSVSSIQGFDQNGKNTFFEKVFKYYSTVCFIGAIILIAVIKWFMGIYVGREFYSAWKYVPLLLVGSVFSAMSAYFSRLYSVVKKNTNVMISTLVSAIINIVANYILIKRIGIIGAVIGTMIAYCVMVHFQMFDIRRYIRFKINYKRYLLNVALLLIEAVMVTLNANTLVHSLIIILASLIINFSAIAEVIVIAKQIGVKRFGKKG